MNDSKEGQRNLPEPANEEGEQEERERDSNHRDTKRMERSVQRVFMTLFILIHPFFHWSVAENDVGSFHDSPEGIG